ncbi:MAG: hypothetical protein AB8F78_11125 [Saprospiraceae bacterium]
MKFRSILLLIACCYFTANLDAQKLEFFGDVPENLKRSTVTLFFEGRVNQRVLPATFIAFKAAGYSVFLDGERRPSFGGLVTSVTVRDTTFTRRSKEVVVRKIHENTPSDLIVTVKGTFTDLAVRKVFINIIDRRTGELLQCITRTLRNTSLNYLEYSEELRDILINLPENTKNVNRR